ncbi:hypothetical protein B566_EDAN012790 [Ephemera danica]|nr:hypothetical protein B566_EDAN012790 [Ephemera danica]
MDNKFDNLTHEQKLKVSVFNDVRKICEEVGQTTKMSFSRKSMDLISELVWRKLKIYGEDLEAFSKHAKRATINSDDVKLLVRRNASLRAHISKIADEINAGKEPRKGKQQKKEAAPASDAGSSTSTDTGGGGSVVNNRADSPFEEDPFLMDQ